uniref:Uncharacterized protein n=1 Tax=Siphoviridae sp. ct8hB11 TaxID=2827790 RepID=A0A8S5ST60_9CAUD|nr:MAG TPA: hypothetical protein [Siphoviridae sp. ct8hB11]
MENNEMTVQNGQGLPNVPVMSNGVAAQLDRINQGTVAIEASRAIAEAQGKLVIAKRFPRDEVAAYAKAMEACQRPKMAEKAFYAFPRGGQTVEGATIRFAEELARCWGNIDYGIKELSQDDGKSEMQAYAWDLETNAQSVQNFTNPHQREQGKKMVTLTSQRDIYENNANMATRRLRARILAILPSWFVEDCIAECKKTLAGQNDTPLVDRVKKMVVQFAKLGVTQEQIEHRLKRKIDTMNADDFTEYIGIYNAIKQNESRISDWFEAEKEATELTAALKEE